MTDYKNSLNENIIKKTEHLLNDVEEFTKEFEYKTDNQKKIGIQEEHQPHFINRDLLVKDNGYTEIRISMDAMKVFADFYPPIGSGKPISFEDVIALLKQKKVKYRIKLDLIKETIALCNEDKKQRNNLLIAEGKMPEDAVPAHYVIEETLLKKDEVKYLEDQKVDFRGNSPFILVKKGQILAKKVKEKQGELGFNVFGAGLSYKIRNPIKIMAGKNVRPENETYVAACMGLFQYKGSLFCVDEVLFVDADVDYKTGHIDFPGDILIRGLVKDGFKINGGKSIFCQSTLDASEVFCKGNLLVKNGIIGKKEGIVKVEGNIKAKFIENCNVEAKGMIEVKTSIINSDVSTLDRISLGDRGVIIGGTIFAQTGVEARQIGNESAPRTEIYCGIDYIVQRKLEWIKKKNIELFIKLKEIQNQISRSEKDNEEMLTLNNSIKNSMDKLNETAKMLIFHLDKNEDAKVIVRGIVYPGTFIEICHVKYMVQRVLPRVIFGLNRRKGKIEIKTL